MQLYLPARLHVSLLVGDELLARIHLVRGRGKVRDRARFPNPNLALIHLAKQLLTLGRQLVHLGLG